ncbi:hypothetical protein NIES4072_65500 [Nostoc commune NIES-4072]|uniref:Uncharacterized protein n=1 Tax=Nostoc commune NIES-4072 TaxID=2005467 RepID=A0A2R5FZE5_NOSCO|nr:hypothetical protein [Nostoc commune]BBD70184.1 hypothetical protein NIES4070_65950 [Nostoc commune HK-02]GBG22838.1 hypothetical protein NIES4072_65500 [Nostoc commune NIES-4072]
MKCIQCGTDNKLKDRTDNQGRCKNCHHPFVFEPTSMTVIRFTDPFFAKAIADISANHTLFFTPKQFFYLIDKRLRTKNQTSLGFLVILVSVYSFFVFGYLAIAAIIIAIFYNQMRSMKRSYSQREKSAKTLRILGIITLIAGIIFSLAINSFSSFAFSVAIGMLAIYLGTRELAQPTNNAQKLTISDSQFQGWLTSWIQVNNRINKILPPPQEESIPITINPDVTAYSFDRLVVCDNAAVAQMLIANNFHFENNCAILSITGYPQNIFDTTMQMLRRNPDLKVYALHDCSAKGMNLLNQLRTSPKWFKDSDITIIDVGLLPRQILAASRSMFIQASPESTEAAFRLSPEIRQSLSAEELAWLESGNFVELESFSPQKLIQILNRGIINSRTLDNDDSSLILVGDSGSYTGSSIYAVESFG